MKKKGKLLIGILFAIFLLWLGTTNVQADSYSIEDMDIQATIKEDGSLSIEQEITYQFKGHYNGIYINIPYYFKNPEKDNKNKTKRLADSFYSASKVKVNGVSLISNGTETKFQEVKQATNGNSFVYTVDPKYGLQQIKAYSPSTNVTKRFKVDYILENVCVKHKDVGEAL